MLVTKGVVIADVPIVMVKDGSGSTKQNPE